MTQYNFNEYSLGQLERGSTVVVTLQGNAANVRLLDSSNLSAFKAGRRHRMYGGMAKSSPVRLQVPSDGRWYVVVDLIGMGPGAQVRSSVSVEPPPLPALPTLRPVAPPSLDEIKVERPPAAGISASGSWDVFISHAWEDKAAVGRPLYEALTAHGVTVWFDEAELRIGDSLRRKIDQGLANSAFGAVIFSESFFAKGWPQYELDGIVTQSVAGGQNLLPIWHKISKDEVRSHSPSLADKVARSTAEFGIADIAEEIARRVRPDLFSEAVSAAS